MRESLRTMVIMRESSQNMVNYERISQNMVIMRESLRIWVNYDQNQAVYKAAQLKVIRII